MEVQGPVRLIQEVGQYSLETLATGQKAQEASFSFTSLIVSRSAAKLLQAGRGEEAPKILARGRLLTNRNLVMLKSRAKLCALD